MMRLDFCIRTSFGRIIIKRVSAKTKWIFAVGQLGWSILAGVISNLLVNFYLPDSTGNGVITYVAGATFPGLTVIGLITAYCTPYNALIPVPGRSQKDRMGITAPGIVSA